ncbi:nitroreductase/quinone reductase family protein [Streptomyces formicae]|uniref:nitroreductase/quinone reductase family protein n=1 Tax=Streptomyces formicae TaxID=1616117 RepID=UPI001F1FD4CC|nr:nitroreductase/quinone reductase family protein [Streptomyces formicae]
MEQPYTRIGPSGVRRRPGLPLLIGTLAVAALLWGQWALPGESRDGVPWPVWGCLALGLNLALTLLSPRAKRALVRALQKYVINPPMRLLLHLGLMPLGLALLETRGRVTGKPRRTPVGNGRQGDDFWIVAEHGERAGYVRNIRRDPLVRLRFRVGLRFHWVEGHAEVRPDDDPWALQRTLSRWHPLRALNAVTVQVMSAEPVVVHVRLAPRHGIRKTGTGSTACRNRAPAREPQETP